MKPQISVIIPTFNKIERLKLVMKSFEYQTETPEAFELILVDDGSTDGTDQFAAGLKMHYEMRYIRQKNSGRSHARNTGIRASNGDIILFCDDDCIVSKEFVKSHRNTHSRYGNSVVHGRIFNLPYLKFFKNPSTGELYGGEYGVPEQELTYLNKYLLQPSDLEDLIKVTSQKKVTQFEKQIRRIFDGEYSRLKWLSFTGGNVSCPAGLLKGVGLFDEGLDQRWGCEDLELGYRLYRYGAGFQFCEEGCNYHMAHFRRSYDEDLRISIERFYEKHKDPLVRNLPSLLLGECKTVEQYLEKCGKEGKGADE